MRKIEEWFSDHERVLTALGMVAVAVAIFIAVTLTGCASPTAPAKSGKLYVVNSLWHVVKTVDRSARELVTNDVNAEVEAYNAVTLDDYLRVYADEVPDIDAAPPVNVYIVNPATYAVNTSHEGITRRSLVDNAAEWRQDAQGQLLFIDHVPPLPLVIPPPSMYAWYALYVVDDTGGIVYEDHCGWLVGEVWDGQWILDGGWRNADHYYETTRRGFWNEVVSHVGWTLVEHQIYTEP